MGFLVCFIKFRRYFDNLISWFGQSKIFFNLKAIDCSMQLSIFPQSGWGWGRGGWGEWTFPVVLYNFDKLMSEFPIFSKHSVSKIP